MQRTRRSKEKVCLDLLQVLKDNGPTGRTRLMYRAFLSYGMVDDAMRNLENTGMVTLSKPSSRRYVYSITEKGERTLAKLREIEIIGLF